MSYFVLFFMVVFTTTLCVRGDVLIYSIEMEMQVSEYRDMPARFGNPLPDEGLRGKLVYAHPKNACGEIAKPPEGYDDFGGWIVLIKRGDCNFDDKIRAAQNANFSAAIVHNVNSSVLEPMSANNATGIYIPSVFVSDDTGLILAQKYQYEEDYYIVLNDDLPFNINTTLVLPFAIVVGICFVVMVIFMIVKCIKNQRRQRRNRLPSSSLRKIPTAKYQKGDPYETCAICLEDYQENEKLRILPCSHAYHCKCIDPWLTKNRRVCPVCKRKVFAEDEHVSDTESDTDTDDTTPLLRQGSYGTQGGTFTQQGRNIIEHTESPSSLSSVFSCECQHTESYKQSQPDSSHSSDDSESLYVSPTEVYTQVHNTAYNIVSSSDHSINSAEETTTESSVPIASSSGTESNKDVII